MEWLQTHWLALVSLAVLGWAADRFVETFTTLASRSDQGEGGLTGLVDLLTTRPHSGRSELQ